MEMGSLEEPRERIQATTAEQGLLELPQLGSLELLPSGTPQLWDQRNWDG